MLREVWTMWKYTKMVVLVAVSAAFYAALVIPLKIVTIVPGITEFRPGAVVPVVFGLLFGPAGAWGAAFGNIINDFFGTLGIGSVGGFVGNFFYGLVGYKLWASMGLANSREDLAIDSGKKTLNFILIAILSSLVCAEVVAWWLEVVRLLPFAVIGPIIALNNALACLVLGVPLMRLLYRRLNRWDLVWFAIMDERDRPKGPSPKVGAVLIWAGVLGGFVVGISISLGATEAVPFTFGTGATTPSVALGVTPFLVMLIVGCLLA
ncbi:MAG: QueT transporter family protein [Candidatus Abyssobacteria bacterium SURF_17]|jgi:energy-coupling factor transport system substrate-specific component|uniref:QueT transporter family protein n=1 Tax=Candidatus Abyssobacteria bacterium SURF_17 TaxID=2093361 RepID=A0A419EMV8_9BACT|nr:MAG: QueT transporter family protein [Candidatus Abyssubacteria bacterium SURF_17]